MVERCPECQRLWDALEKRTFAHVRILNDQRRAMLSYEDTPELSARLDKAAEARTEALRNYKEHRETHKVSDIAAS